MKITAILRRALIDVMVVVFVFFLWTSSSIAPVFAVDAEVDSSEQAAAEDFSSFPYTKTFTITAYYSPLPCQDRYVTGSYDSDRRLNGNGVAGADGTAVYPGMIAAPKTYDFGTKMYIPGVGTVAVHDRGGAIVAGGGREGAYDRLDIWMGYGDIGLQRALTWGKRTVDVTVFGQDSSIQEIITLTPAFSAAESEPNCDPEPVVVEEEREILVPEEPAAEPKVVEEPAVAPEVVVPEVEKIDEILELGDSGAEVEQLQKELSALNFLKTPPSGVYDEVTRHAVFKFQQSQYLVGNSSSPGAGVFGPKTQAKLNSILAARTETKQLVAQANKVDPLAFGDGFKFNSELDFGAVGPEVKFVQSFLQDQGYFDHALTNYFGPVTREALIAFQIDYGIIQSANDLGAGRVGQGTLAVINDLI